MPGCQQAWRPEAWILDPWRLVGLLAGWQDWIGLDVSGCWIGGSGGIGGFPVFSHARRSRRSADIYLWEHVDPSSLSILHFSMGY